MKKTLTQLQEKIKKFIESDKTTATLESIKIVDIRELYRSRNSKFGQLLYCIFNSMWNREPNYSQNNVVKEKFGYAFRIGIGIASYNLLPLSYIYRFCQNLLMKDRGHILELVIGKYTQKFNALLLRNVFAGEIKEIKEGNNQWADDIQAKKAIDTGNKVINYLNNEINNAKKSKQKAEVSLKDICDNVIEFGNGINETEIAVEMRKESIYFHMKEILRINNGQNEWIAYLKSFLELCSYALSKDTDETYLNEKLDIERLRQEIKKLPVFTRNHQRKNSTKNLPMSKGVTYYSKNLDESVYYEPMAIRYLGMTCAYPKFKDRASAYFVSPGAKGNVEELSKQLKGLHDKKLKFSDASTKLRYFNMIAESTAWESYSKKQKALVETYKNEGHKMNNLEDADITAEDFGMACVDACLEIASKNGIDRNSPPQLEDVVNEFVEALITRLNDTVNDEKIFIEGQSMVWRFNNIIKRACDMVIENREQTNGKTDCSEKVYHAHLDELFREFSFNGQTSFSIINPVKDWKKKPEIVTITFDKAKSRAESGLDLAHKKQTTEVTVKGTFLQVRGENRSQNKVEHIIDNIDYMPRFAKQNEDRVNELADYLHKNKLYDVLSDSGKLVKLFTKKNKK